MNRPNVPILLFSVALSLSAWFILYGQNLAKTASVYVRLTEANTVGLPKHLFIDQINPINLDLSGPTGEIDAAQNRGDLANLISIDLSTASANQQTYPLTFDRQIANLVVPGQKAKVKLEEIISKTIPVKVEPRGTLDDPSSSLGSYPASETSVTVSGPKSMIDQITLAKAILQLDQIDSNNPKSQEATLLPEDNSGRIFGQVLPEPQHVRIDPIIVAAQVDKKVIVSANIVGAPAPGYVGKSYKVNPQELNISGPSATLVYTSHVDTEKVDVSGLTATKQFKVGIITPRGTSSRTHVAYVTVVIEPDTKLRNGVTSKPLNATKPPLSPQGTTAGRAGP